MQCRTFERCLSRAPSWSCVNSRKFKHRNKFTSSSLPSWTSCLNFLTTFLSSSLEKKSMFGVDSTQIITVRPTLFLNECFQESFDVVSLCDYIYNDEVGLPVAIVLVSINLLSRSAAVPPLSTGHVSFFIELFLLYIGEGSP